MTSRGILWPKTVPAALTVRLTTGDFGRDRRAESTHFATAMLGKLDAAFAQQQFCVNDVNIFFQGAFQQAGTKRIGQQFRIAIDDFATIGQLAARDGSAMPLAQEQPQAIGDIQVTSQRVERLGIQRGDVDRVANLTGLEEIEQQVNSFHGDLRLCLFGAGSQVRRTNDAGHAEQGTVRTGLVFEDVQGHARQSDRS